MTFHDLRNASVQSCRQRGLATGKGFQHRFALAKSHRCSHHYQREDIREEMVHPSVSTRGQTSKRSTEHGALNNRESIRSQTRSTPTRSDPRKRCFPRNHQSNTSSLQSRAHCSASNNTPGPENHHPRVSQGRLPSFLLPPPSPPCPPLPSADTIAAFRSTHAAHAEKLQALDIAIT